MLDATDDASDTYDLYVRFGALPNLADYDDKGDLPDADQAVEIAQTQAGTYYLLARSRYSGGAYSITEYVPGAPQEIDVSTPITDTLQGTNDSKVFRVDVEAGQRLIGLLDGADDNNVYQFYLKFGTPPTADLNDDMGKLPTADQAVEITTTQAGTYYLMVQSEEGGGEFNLIVHTGATMPVVNSGGSVSDRLDNTNDTGFYRIVTGDDGPLRLMLEDTTTFNDYVLYLKYGSLPSTGISDEISTGIGPRWGIRLPHAPSGVYYVMVRSSSGGGTYNLKLQTGGAWVLLPLIGRGF